MAGEAGPKTDDLISRVKAEPYRFDFFQLLRRLENLDPSRPRIGFATRPSEEQIRLCQIPNLAFAPSTVAAWKDRTDTVPAPRVFVHFLGMLGPHGPLPLHLTEYVRNRERHFDDPTLARFMDMFNHRVLSLFYRAWSSSRKTVNYERGEQDRFAMYIGSLFGIGMDHLRHRDEVPDEAKLHFAGRSSSLTRHPEGLAAVIGSFFDLPVRIEEFIGQWVDLEPEYTCRLGNRESTGLGSTAIVGARIWDVSQRFRVVLGPLTLPDFERFLPGGDSLDRLVGWINNLVGFELQWDANLVLKKDEVPATRLGQQGRLGWSTWMHSRPFENDADDLKLNPSSATSARN